MRVIATMLCALLPFSMPVHAGTAAEDVQVVAPWVRATPPMSPNSAAFMELHNKGEVAHALVAASGTVAQAIELHTHTNEGGVMQMRRVEQMDIPAGGVTALAPMGLHIMLIGLQGPIAEGDKVQLQLEFEDGSTTSVEAEARTVSGMGMMHQNHQH